MILNLELPIEVLENLKADFRQIAREEWETREQQKQNEKYISPKEVCQLFQPAISKVTLWSWSKNENSPLKKYHIGGRVYYKYGEVMSAVKTYKKYRRF